MKKLDRKTVQVAMMSWAVRHKEAKYTMADLQVMLDEYHQDLIELDFTDELFIIAEKIVRKSSRYFPKIKDFVEVKDQALQQHEQKESRSRKRLPEPGEKQLSNREYGLRCIENINKMLAGNLSMDESIKRNSR